VFFRNRYRIITIQISTVENRPSVMYYKNKKQNKTKKKMFINNTKKRNRTAERTERVWQTECKAARPAATTSVAPRVLRPIWWLTSQQRVYVTGGSTVARGFWRHGDFRVGVLYTHTAHMPSGILCPEGGGGGWFSTT